MSDPVETAAWWLAWIETGKIIAALLVAIGVAGEFFGDFIAKPLERRIEAARQAELAQLKNENLRLTKEIEEERTRRVAIESQLAPRRLDINQYQSMVAELRQFRGQKLNVLLPAEPEPRLYGESIIKALEESGWTLHVTRAINSIPQPIYGLYVAGPHPESSSAIQALISELVTAGNPVYSEGSNDAEFFLSINLKPQPGVSITMPNRDPKLWHLPLGSNWTL